MKLEIYQEKPEEVKEEPVQLALKQIGDSITVQAVDEIGHVRDCGNLITFYSDGTIKRHPGVNDVLRFQLNNRNQIKEREADD